MYISACLFYSTYKENNYLFREYHKEIEVSDVGIKMEKLFLIAYQDYFEM